MDSRWVAFETWKFAVEITAEESARLASQDQVVLFLGGVDTIADVAVNGHTVSTTNNFHRFVCNGVRTNHSAADCTHLCRMQQAAEHASF